jgi:diguanylate cyclase
MGKKTHPDRNVATGGPSEADKNASLPDPSMQDIAGSQSAAFEEEQADLRKDIAAQRQEAADEREVAARLSASTLALLREANERLVVATIHAQTMIEAADLAKERMSHMAEHDGLTGLPNRSLLTDRLAQAIALAQRNGKKVALMYLDLDHFKCINDSLGHVVGDKLLQSAAKRLQSCARLTDTISRQGGG